MVFNPFDKPIHEKLIKEDLQLLVDREVAEGYTVEYKRDFPDKKKVAKSIASFANTMGGWLFIGIEEDKHIAKSIYGIDINTTLNDSLRDTIKTYIDPIPIYYLQVIALDREKCVIAIFIPDSQDTPFITKDGRIYRRTADSSDPVSENNRFSIDRLLDQGREKKKAFDKFCKDERMLCKADAEIPWIIISILPYPTQSLYNLRDIETLASIQENVSSQINVKIEDIIAFSGTLVDLNIIQPRANSILIKNSFRDAFSSLMVELFKNGGCKF